MTRRERWLLIALFLSSLLVNGAYVILLGDHLSISGDSIGYDRGGLDVAKGEGLPGPKREPGYYVFLGAIYRVFGHDHLAVRLAQAVLTSSFCLLVFAMVREISAVAHLSSGVAWAAAALTVVYPGFVFYTGSLHREILLTFLFLVSLLFLTRYALSERLREAALGGLFIGLAALVDGRVFFFPLFLGAAYLVAGKSWQRTARFVAASFGVALLVVAPWSVRSSLAEHRFVLTSSSPYKGLFLATNPENPTEWEWEREPLKSLRWLPADERNRAIERLALENLRNHPWEYLASMAPRLFRLWVSGHSYVGPMERSLAAAVDAGEWSYAAVKALALATNLLYLFGGVIGAVLYLRRFAARPVLHLLLFPVYLSLLHMLLYSTPRYQIPAIPTLIVFFAYLVAARASRG